MSRCFANDPRSRPTVRCASPSYGHNSPPPSTALRFARRFGRATLRDEACDLPDDEHAGGAGGGPARPSAPANRSTSTHRAWRPSTIAAGVSADQPCAISLDARSARATPIRITIEIVFGRTACSVRSTASDSPPAPGIPMRCRGASPGCPRAPARPPLSSPRNNSRRYARHRQRERFFAAAAETNGRRPSAGRRAFPCFAARIISAVIVSRHAVARRALPDAETPGPGHAAERATSRAS